MAASRGDCYVTIATALPAARQTLTVAGYSPDEVRGATAAQPP